MKKLTCINPNSIQVKELSEELGLKPIIVAAKIAVWQDKNNTDKFPSANNLVEGLKSNEKTTSNQTEITIGNKKYKQGIYSFKEIFENIGEKSYANKLLKMLYGLSNQNIDNMKVEIVDNIEEAGHFDNGIIRLNINSLNPETVFTHEVIHALTALKLAYWKKNSPKVYKDMEKVWIDSKAISDPLNERYEFSSLDEFYAALSKQSFVEELASVKDDSFIGKLIQLFKDMLSKLGIKVEGTLVERALNNLSEIVQAELVNNLEGMNKVFENNQKLANEIHKILELNPSMTEELDYYLNTTFLEKVITKYPNLFNNIEMITTTDDFKKLLEPKLKEIKSKYLIYEYFDKEADKVLQKIEFDNRTEEDKLLQSFANIINKSTNFIQGIHTGITKGFTLDKSFKEVQSFYKQFNLDLNKSVIVLNDKGYEYQGGLIVHEAAHQFDNIELDLINEDLDNIIEYFYKFAQLKQFGTIGFINPGEYLKLEYNKGNRKETIPILAQLYYLYGRTPIEKFNKEIAPMIFSQEGSKRNKAINTYSRYIKEKFDSNIYNNGEDYVVLDNGNPYYLGTKQDIENFKNWLKEDNNIILEKLKSEEGSQEDKGKLSKDNVQVGDLIVNNNVGLRVTSLNENDLTTEDGQTIPYDADFNVFRTAPNEISENPSLEDMEDFLTEEEDVIELNPTEVLLNEKALTFWQKIVQAFETESDKLKPASTSQSGKLLFNENVSSATSFAKLNKDIDVPLLQAIRQAATISLYTNKLKYNLLDKSGTLQDKDAYTDIVNNSLLSLAKFIKESYDGNTSDWSNEKHKKFTQIAEYIRSYIISHQPIMGEMKSILKQSKNQKNEIEQYLKSIGKVDADLNNTFQDMQEVIDTMEEIQILLDNSNHFATYLITNNKTQVSKSIVAENKKIGRENELINLKVEQLKLKIDATENEEQKISLQAQIDKELAKIKELKSDDLVLDINKELKDGNDTGILTAIFGAIGDFGDKSLTLLRNRVEDAFQELKEKLIPIGKNMQNAWESFSEGKNISLNDSKVFEKFVEKVNYIDLDGNERSELHFISERNMEEYYKEYHEVDNKVKELYNKIADLQSTYKKDAVEFEDVQKEEEFNAEIRKQVKALYSEIGKIQDAFTAKLTWKFAAINTFTNENGDIEDFPEAEQGIDKHLMRVYNAFIATAGEKDGFWHFKNYMQDNFQLKRMKYDSIYKSKTMDEYLKAVIATKFKQGDSLITLHKKYSSRILVPQKSKYPSNKLEKLSDDEKKLFDVITGIYYKSQENIPEFMRPGTRVPSISKGLMQRVMNDEFSFSKLMQEEFGDYFSDEVNENPNKSIPIYYTNNRMKAEDISQNFVSTVLLFTKQAMAYKTKAQTLGIAKEMQNAIGKTKQKDLNGNQIFNKALAKLGIKEALPIGSDWRNWFLDSWIDQVFYGKTNRAINVKLGSKVVRVDKILQKLMSFSAFGTLGGVKVVNHLTNISMANISNLLESTGYFKESEAQPLFTKSQYAKTLAGDVWKSLRDMLLDSANNKEFGSSVYAQLIEEFEPIQGEFFDRFGNAINSGKINSKKLQDVWFAPLHLGDLQPQLCAFIAMMQNIPVKLIEGGETNLWDALTVSDDLNQNWKTIENWRTVKQELVDKKRKLDELNKKLHGNYNSVANIDRPLARQTVLGQMFEMYRKFIVPGMLLRYGEQRYDINRDEMVEGRYRTLFNYLINDMKWLLKAENKITPLDILFPNENNIEKIRKYYSDEQIVNIRKAVVEQMFITLTSILAVLLYGLSKGGDDDDYILLTTASVVLRVSRDYNFFSPISIDSPLTETGDLTLPITTAIPDYLRVFKQPFAAQRTVDNLQDMITMLTSNPTELYKTGEHKGESKLKVKTKKLLGISYGTSPADIISLMYEKTN